MSSSDKRADSGQRDVSGQNEPTSRSFPQEITIGDKYGPAMIITDQAEADRYFEACVAHNMSFGTSRQRAEEIERQNLGYFAGYYDTETRLRVERLFLCQHPIFGAVASSVPEGNDSSSVGSVSNEINGN